MTLSCTFSISSTTERKRLDWHPLPADGWDANYATLVFQYHWCYWHGHWCKQDQQQLVEESARKCQQTKLNADYIRSYGFTLMEVWECEWSRLKAQAPSVALFVKGLTDHVVGGKGHLSPHLILKPTQKGVCLVWWNATLRFHNP